jgi:hypothetical protein
MLAVTLVAGVVAVGVSVAVMSSETTEKTRTKADIKYLEAKAPFNFGKDKASVDNFKKLRDDRLIEALRDPRVDLQFVKDLSDDQISNMVKYAGTADVILGMPETQRLSLVDKLSGHLVGANARVVATVLSISPRASATMKNDDGVKWAEVLRQLLELHERSQPDIRGNVQNQIEVIMKTDPELTDVPRTFVEFGARFLSYVRHDALAHVIHAYTDTNSASILYNLPAMRNFTQMDAAVVQKKLGSYSNPGIENLLRKVLSERRPGASQGDPIEEYVDQRQVETGILRVPIPGGPYRNDRFTKNMGKLNYTVEYSSANLGVIVITIHELEEAYAKKMRFMPMLQNARRERDAAKVAYDNLDIAGKLASTNAANRDDVTKQAALRADPTNTAKQNDAAHSAAEKQNRQNEYDDAVRREPGYKKTFDERKKIFEEKEKEFSTLEEEHKKVLQEARKSDIAVFSLKANTGSFSATTDVQFRILGLRR